MIGIYAIYRKSDDKCLYVGQSKNIERRINEHTKYKYNSHLNLENIDCYGKCIEIFDFYEKENQLNREAYWIDLLKPELNIDKNRHHFVSNETRNKMSESQKGRTSCMKGKHHTKETKNKIGEGNKGKHQTEKTKQYLSNLYKGKTWIVENGKRVWC